MAVGLVLAALKILPAATLGLWLLVARDRAAPARRSIVVAGVTLAILTVPVLLRDPGAIYDMIRSQFNMVPWPGTTNFAPQVRLAPLLGPEVAKILSWTAGLALAAVILVRRLDGPGGFLIAACAPLLLTPQLWANWFVIPAIAILATAPEWRVIQALDRRLAPRPGAGASA
jgi:alpha-1,2-mannosyltransferase